MRFIFLSVIALLFSANLVQAAFVKYIDKTGKSHYVNTDYSRVPDEYLDQVRDQLPKIPETGTPVNMGVSLNTEIPTIPVPGNNIVVLTPNPVEIFVKANCPNCDRLETLLQANKIPYTRFDTEITPQGKAFIESLTNTNMELPLTRINGQILTGIDINAIKTALRAAAGGKGL